MKVLETGLMAEAGEGDERLLRQPPDRARRQVADPSSKDFVGRQADRAVDALLLQPLVDLWLGEGRIGAELDRRQKATIKDVTRLEGRVAKRVRVERAPEGMLTSTEAAARLGRHPNWLRYARKGNHEGPPFHRVGGRYFYRPEDLDSFIAKHRGITTTGSSQDELDEVGNRYLDVLAKLSDKLEDLGESADARRGKLVKMIAADSVATLPSPQDELTSKAYRAVVGRLRTHLGDASEDGLDSRAIALATEIIDELALQMEQRASELVSENPASKKHSSQS